MTLQDLANLALVLTPMILIAGFWFARGQLQESNKQTEATRKARMAQIVISLVTLWDSGDMVESRRRLNECGKGFKTCFEDADKKNSAEAYGALVRVANFFDTLGLLVKEGFLDCGMAYDLFGKASETYFAIYKPVITDPTYKDYVPYFKELHSLFVNEEGRRTPTEQRPT